MIIVRLMGGLGNQMFQAAFGYALSKEFTESVVFENSAYKSYKIRPCSIQNLEICKTVPLHEITDINNINPVIYRVVLEIYHVYQKLIRFVKKEHYGCLPYQLLSRYGLFFDFDRFFTKHRCNNNNINKIVYGYFQSEQYFKKYKKEIQNMFQVKTAPTDVELVMLNKIKSVEAVGVSMRLQDDYKKSKSLNICGSGYYLDGMKYIHEQKPNTVFYVFADDIEAAKKIKFEYPVVFVEGLNDYQSLRLLYSCKHFVIANSSFSWWGAYLSTNDEKMVIAPHKWFSDIKDVPSIYNKELIKLQVKEKLV